MNYENGDLTVGINYNVKNIYLHTSINSNECPNSCLMSSIALHGLHAVNCGLDEWSSSSLTFSCYISFLSVSINLSFQSTLLKSIVYTPHHQSIYSSSPLPHSLSYIWVNSPPHSHVLIKWDLTSCVSLRQCCRISKLIWRVLLVVDGQNNEDNHSGSGGCYGEGVLCIFSHKKLSWS